MFCTCIIIEDNNPMGNAATNEEILISEIFSETNFMIENNIPPIKNCMYGIFIYYNNIF